MLRNIIISCLCLLVLTGCKSVKTTCSKTVIDESDIKMQESFGYTFKSKEMDKIEIEWQYVFRDDVNERSNSMKKELEAQFAMYDKSKGVKYKTYTIPEGIGITITLNIGKLTDEELMAFEIATQYRENSYTDTIKGMNKEGYVCK